MSLELCQEEDTTLQPFSPVTGDHLPHLDVFMLQGNMSCACWPDSICGKTNLERQRYLYLLDYINKL